MVTFVFRADASSQIGFGHVMRCLTLAQALQSAGHACHFMVRQLPDVLQQRLQTAGMNLHWLDYAFVADAARPFVVDAQADAAQTSLVLDRIHGSKTLIVDHYGLGLEWERNLRSTVARLMVIDDLAVRPHDCDLLLDQNLGRTEADYRSLVPDSCRILAGTPFTLLRREFAQMRTALTGRSVPVDARSVLINLGGGDHLPLLTETLRNLIAHFQSLSLHITLITGQPIDEHALCATLVLPERWTLTLLSNIDHMADVLASTDIAIGAAGSSAWERCCLGVPSILLVLAANQRVIADALAEQGAARVATTQDDLISAFRHLLDVSVRSTLRERSLALCDGLGAQRVVAELLV